MTREDIIKGTSRYSNAGNKIPFRFMAECVIIGRMGQMGPSSIRYDDIEKMDYDKRGLMIYLRGGYVLCVYYNSIAIFSEKEF